MNLFTLVTSTLTSSRYRDILSLALVRHQSRKVKRYAKGRNQIKAQNRTEDDGMTTVSASGVTAIVFQLQADRRRSCDDRYVTAALYKQADTDLLAYQR